MSKEYDAYIREHRENVEKGFNGWWNISERI